MLIMYRSAYGTKWQWYEMAMVRNGYGTKMIFTMVRNGRYEMVMVRNDCNSIRRTYTYLDEQSFKYVFQALVRPHIEYAEAVWSPFKVGDIEKIENVQRRATKQVPTLKNMEYNERLKKLKMPTLKYRRMRGDMIEVFKIINDIYDPLATVDMFELQTSRKPSVRRS